MFVFSFLLAHLDIFAGLLYGDIVNLLSLRGRTASRAATVQMEGPEPGLVTSNVYQTVGTDRMLSEEEGGRVAPELKRGTKTPPDGGN